MGLAFISRYAQIDSAVLIAQPFYYSFCLPLPFSSIAGDRGMIDVGLVGFGFAGRVFHAPVISSVTGLRLRAIVQRHGGSAASLFSQAQIVRSVDELLTFD